MQRRLRVALLLLEYIEETLTTERLLRLLKDMADTLRIDNWEEVGASGEMAALQAAPKDRKVWTLSSLPETSDTLAASLWDLVDVKGATKAILEHIRGNIEHGRAAFHNGLGGSYVDSIIKDKLSGFAPGKAVLYKDELRRGKELRVMPVEGVPAASLAALPAALLDELLRTKAWQYLKACSVCGKQFIPRRLDATTCSPRCRKRRSLDREKVDSGG
jgi:hypothetical protein